MATRTEAAAGVEREGTVPRTTETGYGVRFYLVPEGADFPPSVDQVAARLNAEQQDLITRRGVRPAFHMIPIWMIPIWKTSEPKKSGLSILAHIQRLSYHSRNQTLRRTAAQARTASTAVPRFFEDAILDIAGDPLVEVDLVGITDQDITPADAQINFEDGVIDLVLDDGIEGQIIAVENNIFLGDVDIQVSVAFLMIPEGAVFTLPAAEAAKLLPSNDNGVF